MIEQIIGLIIFAFVCELIDSSLGMGYGTTLTPILLLLGFEPIMVVPAILLSELFTGIFAGIGHHKAGNVDLKESRYNKTLLILVLCSVIGTIVGVNIVLNIPTFWLKLYIGLLILFMGIWILISRNKIYKFSYKKVTLLGLIASFNKGASGGGYGPVVTSGQILSGVDAKGSVGITSLAEGLTCIVGIGMFALLGTIIDWSFTLPLMFGAILSVPFSIKLVNKLDEIILKRSIALVTIILGLVTLIKLVI